MKKFLVGLFVVVLLVLATSVAFAAQKPPGVDAAIRVSENGCTVTINGSSYQSTKFFKQYSNGATGHSISKCKVALVDGPVENIIREFNYGSCAYKISIKGKNGMVTAKCFGDWSP